MQLLRVLFAFIRSFFAGLSSVMISYGKFLEASRLRKKPARKAHRPRRPTKVGSVVRKKSSR